MFILARLVSRSSRSLAVMTGFARALGGLGSFARGGSPDDDIAPSSFLEFFAVFSPLRAHVSTPIDSIARPRPKADRVRMAFFRL